MQQVSIIGTAQPGLLHTLIKWFTNSDTTHVMIGYDDDRWGGRWTAAADLDGVRLYQAEKTCKYASCIYVTKFDAATGLKKIASIINQPYNFGNLVAIAVTTLAWRWFKQKVKHPCRNPRAQICSEFVARFFQACNLEETSGWDPEAITPADIKNYCDAHPELFTKVK